MNTTTAIRIKRFVSIIVAIILTAAFVVPANAGEQKTERKTVRVGWYDSSFNLMDETGRRSGYAYEYQQKLSSYTGWEYEYVSESWPVLLEMLENGEIDLLSDVSYTLERDGRMLFPSLPMGTEEYYVFVSPENEEISRTDFSSLNGKRVGINKGSVQIDFYRDWEEKNGIHSEIIEVTSSEEESLQMIKEGEIDAYVTVDSFVAPGAALPLCKVGSSDFFFAVNKDRPDLLSELNVALNRLQDENRYYNQQMFEKYFKRAAANVVLSPEEERYLSEHGTIRVGYQDHYMAFCQLDEETGELTGVLKDYLELLSRSIANVKLDFETIAYPTAAEAMDALKRGEIDCAFPANLNSYDAEQMEVVMTPPLMDTEMYAVVRSREQQLFDPDKQVVVAVNEGNPNYDIFLANYFPNWKAVYYPTTPDCLKAVSEGAADCVLISSYRYNNISRICSRYHLTTVTTGVSLDYSFAIRKGETELYCILAKAIGLVPDSAIYAALSYYLTKDAKLTFSDFLSDNIGTVMAVTVLIVLIILFLLVRSRRSEHKAKELISATERDRLTGLYNRDFFFQYANRICREHPDTEMDAIVLNIEQFHTVNALSGREFGDQVLRVLGSEIEKVAEENGGIAGRFGADRFDIFCRHVDFYQTIYERLQNRLSELSVNTSLRLRMGVMPSQKGIEPVQQFDNARAACSMARGNYKKPLIIFDEKIREREIYEQRLLNDLRRALDSCEFEAYYQPKFDIQVDPPKLMSAEALIRWNHPELGMIPPDDFIPLFERNGQISRIDQYIWMEAARQVVFWKNQYGVELPVSVNLSRIDVFDPLLEDTLEAILDATGLDHAFFKLEVTETAYTENEDQVIEVVNNLRSKGYEVEMDDFGTGYSSLSMLSAMPIDVLKMDREFIRNIEHSEKDIKMVALILDIARNLRIPVIAEGVETEEQIRLLKNLGCQLVQGFYFSRPLKASEFEQTFILNGKE